MLSALLGRGVVDLSIGAAPASYQTVKFIAGMEAHGTGALLLFKIKKGRKKNGQRGRKNIDSTNNTQLFLSVTLPHPENGRPLAAGWIRRRYYCRT